MLMEGLYKNKYKIKSTRFKNHNYSQPGYYFLTICTTNRFCYFGDIKNNKMILNNCGKIILQELLKTPQIRENVILDEFIIMPNHIHAIIIIGEPIEINNDVVLQTNFLNNTHDPQCRDALNASPVGDDTITLNTPTTVGDAFNASLQTNKPYQNKFGPQKNNISSIVRGFKSTTNKQINKLIRNNYFSWQSRFWDHVIRNEESLFKIRQYIRDNPAKWSRDRNNHEGLLM